MPTASLERIFNPRSIAIIGVSSTPGKAGRLVLENLLTQGFDGRIFPVNPNLREIIGRRCYSSAAELPQSIDLAVILVPASQVDGTLLECTRHGIKNFVIISAGFKETGEQQGKDREKRLSKLASEYGIRIVGPNCLGVFDNISRVDTFFLPRSLIRRPEKGTVSLASQSGSFVGHLMDLASTESLGIARAITYGNRVDVSEADSLDYFAADKATSVIGLYVEGVSDGMKFSDSLEKATRTGKPVVVLKGGKHETLSSAITSHTGALASSYTSYRAAFKKARAIEVDSLEEFVDTCKAFSKLAAPLGIRVLIITHAGGLGLNVADHCVSLGLEVPKLETGLEKQLRKVVLPFASLTNPIDLTASGTDEQTESVLRLCLDSDFDMAIYLALWGLQQSTDRIGEIVLSAMKRSGKPIVVATLAGKICTEKRHIFEDLDVPVFPSLERAARVAFRLTEKHVTRQQQL